jgi:hypothetical protein
MSKIVWQVDGVALPRNPDSYDFKYDKANVTYLVYADGSQARVSAPRKLAGADFVMTWKSADRRTLSKVFTLLNNVPPTTLRKVLLDGRVPAMQAWCYFDTPQQTMSSDVVDTRLGAGGTRNDLTLTARLDGPYLHSAVPVPSGAVAGTMAPFAGWLGSGQDGIPTWNGNAYNFAGSTGTVTLTNMGTAGWSPVILFSGAFATISMKATYFDADGTGQGVLFTWTGAALGAGDKMRFNTDKKTVQSNIGGAGWNDVYTFTVTTVNDGLPFSYWPPAPSGNFSLTFANTGAAGTIDLTNGGTETFRYWG